jgi:hypothetical protein
MFEPVDIKEVIDFIENELIIKKSQYTTEKNVENVIAKQMCNNFFVHQQYNIGGFLGLKCDLDINNGSIGIELKLAKELQSASNIERLFGQVVYYKHRCYKENLIVLIVGKNMSNALLECSNLLSELGVRCIFKKIAE